MEKNTIIFIIIGILCFCLLLSAIGGGGYYYYYDVSGNTLTPTPSATTPSDSTPSATTPSATTPSATTPASTTPTSTTPTSTTPTAKPLDYTKWSSIKNRVNNESDEIFANRIYDSISGVQDRGGGRNFVRDNLKNVMTVDDNTAALFCTNPCYWYPETTIQQGYCGNCKKINPKWTGCTKSEQCMEGTSCLISNTTTNNGRCLTKDDCKYAVSIDGTTGNCDTSL